MAGRQATRHLDTHDDLTSEKRERYEQLAERGKIAKDKNKEERDAKRDAEAAKNS